MKKRRKSKFLQGFYNPKHPEKYKGRNINNIVYRSSWEYKFLNWCDNNESVLEYSSEEFYIPWRNRIDNSTHRYFPDFKIKIKNKENIIETWVVEIKPKNQTTEPVPQKNKTVGYIKKVELWIKNKSKWDSARQYCEGKGYKFCILTEDVFKPKK